MVTIRFNFISVVIYKTYFYFYGDQQDLFFIYVVIHKIYFLLTWWSTRFFFYLRGDPQDLFLFIKWFMILIFISMVIYKILFIYVVIHKIYFYFYGNLQDDLFISMW